MCLRNWSRPVSGLQLGVSMLGPVLVRRSDSFDEWAWDQCPQNTPRQRATANRATRKMCKSLLGFADGAEMKLTAGISVYDIWCEFKPVPVLGAAPSSRVGSDCGSDCLSSA